MSREGVGTVASATMTRPADTTAYASGDLVANSTTAGSVVPLSWAVQRSRRIGAKVVKARIKKSGTGVTNSTFRVHLYRASPTVANGDNGAWSSDKAADYLGYLEVVVDKAFTDGAAGSGAPAVGTGLIVAEVSTTMLYGLLECRGAYTPASAETFVVTLELERD